MEYMDLAIREAEKAFYKGEVPVGVVIVKDGQIISQKHNLKEEMKLTTAHAEILAIEEASKKLNNWRLSGCHMYVTLEPCPMCAWAIIQSGIKTLYFGSYNTQYGAMGSVLDLPKLANSKIKIFGGIEEEKCNKILEDFWKKVRNNDNKI